MAFSKDWSHNLQLKNMKINFENTLGKWKQTKVSERNSNKLQEEKLFFRAEAISMLEIST
jgi:hypothetical protein